MNGAFFVEEAQNRKQTSRKKWKQAIHSIIDASNKFYALPNGSPEQTLLLALFPS